MIDNPAPNAAAQLTGITVRGMGSLKLNSHGINEVQNDYHIATAADIVAEIERLQADVARKDAALLDLGVKAQAVIDTIQPRDVTMCVEGVMVTAMGIDYGSIGKDNAQALMVALNSAAEVLAK